MLIQVPNTRIASTGWQLGAPWRRKYLVGDRIPYAFRQAIVAPNGEREALKLFHFSPNEFDHADLMDPVFLLQLDYFRECCGFPLKVTDDARTWEEHRALYRDTPLDEIPRGSAHLAVSDPQRDHGLATAVDLRARPHGHVQRATMTWVALEFHRIGIWPLLGLIVETRHHHIDHLQNPAKRPWFDIGVSR